MKKPTHKLREYIMASSLDTFVEVGCWEESLNALLEMEDNLDPVLYIFAAIKAVVRENQEKSSGGSYTNLPRDFQYRGLMPK